MTTGLEFAARCIEICSKFMSLLHVYRFYKFGFSNHNSDGSMLLYDIGHLFEPTKSSTAFPYIRNTRVPITLETL